MSGWNKGIKGAPGGGMKDKKHSSKTLEKMRGQTRSPEQKENISRSLRGKSFPPKPSVINSDELCHYGCETTAKYQFANGKVCCSKHQNSCSGKRKQFSDRDDHAERAAKSLATRTTLGITKSSRVKANETMVKNGTYEVMREKMQEHWRENPHQNNIRCPLLQYKETTLMYQGSYEFNFLEKIEKSYGLGWVGTNVTRGPSLWYTDTNFTKRLYISDFLIDNTIYEIKSKWTWNKHGIDMDLESNNKAKLTACIEQGYSVILVLEGQEIKYDQII